MTRHHARRLAAHSVDGRSPRLQPVRRLETALASCTAAGLIGAGLMLVAPPAASAQAGAPTPFETIVTATPVVLQLSPLTVHLFQLSATLVWVQPISNASIVFTAGNTTLCTAMTNNSGTASCNVLTSLTNVVAVVAAGGYTATFGGDHSFPPGFAPSSGTAGLIQ
jgi:hypothetical protein